MKHNYTARDILKTEGILTMGPDEPLSVAFKKFTSSHDVIMVVNDKRMLLGVVSPYYVQIRRQRKPETKLKHVLTHPPHCTLNMPLTEIIRLILESKLHNLPIVNEKKEILGIVTARRVLERLAMLDISGDRCSVLTNEKEYLQTVNMGSSMNEALEFYKRTKYSKIIVVDEHNHLKGIISVFDTLGRDCRNRLVEDCMKRHVVTVPERATVKTIITTMLEKEIGSIIIVKPGNIPVQIITTSDILKWALE